MSSDPVHVVGAGLAGCEAAWALARAGLPVSLWEQKPRTSSPAHRLPGPAELVCSNSLKSDDPDSAHGLLKAELRALGSIVLAAADEARVPAGTALAVDRAGLSQGVARRLAGLPGLELRAGEALEAPPAGEVVLATGPLTDGALAGWLRARVGDGPLYFYDALAPIVSADGLDLARLFAGSRWGQGGQGDYLNSPLDEPAYRRFVEALLAAPRTPLHAFEAARYYEGCLPVEVMAERGPDTLAFGPMRPVGLEVDGRRPFAVVQLRAENLARTAFNLVGFQTKLTQPAQREVFRLLPGLERAEFLRFGAVHRNLYVRSPEVLDDGLRLRAEPRVRLAGQITGAEGYVESAAVGLLVGHLLAAERAGRRFEPPPAETALGALYAHLRGRTGAQVFEPMNIHFGLLPHAPGRGKRARQAAALLRARQAFAGWLAGQPLPGVGHA
ncbi:MAG TPA: methylenetetrahydrofolate--tRNA-(uracil(54)-C(5))-methyltransferase (FADH(2)-oxidizing) TrmFO [Myxococcota bacterium]|nr:methylenetetrahydrofolate--tRNA-(uracil(54)-C(5))-methyltransferase (FADH(2)-oxidizing) TrmFO [Myxococcota bacterium]HRY94775.1 methylenetetrahydrofolate--tRNA-(uracil(54)-C(5))-methyltransferase (FADH(2)-oxidizing) TrmFO [Myxococcota bacterium]